MNEPKLAVSVAQPKTVEAKAIVVEVNQNVRFALRNQPALRDSAILFLP